MNKKNLGEGDFSLYFQQYHTRHMNCKDVLGFKSWATTNGKKGGKGVAWNYSMLRFSIDC